MSAENQDLETTPSVVTNAPIIQKQVDNTRSWKQIALPYITGFISFLIGILLFFPLENLAKSILDQANIQGEPVQYDTFSFSMLGGFSITDLLIPLSKNPGGEFKNTIKMDSLKGSVSLIKLLLKDELVLNTLLENVNLNFIIGDSPLSLSNGTWQINSRGSQFRKPQEDWIANVNFSLVDIIGNYDADLPMVGQKLGKFLVSNLNGEIYLNNNKINIKSIYLDSNVAKIQARGYINLTNPADKSIMVDIDPTGFINKYKEFNIDVMLKSMNILNENAKISLICSGANFSCEPQQVSQIR